ncbi:MAG: putative motility protein [Burkholderiaceae bacterium]|nr:MAG: putative motility protein [Burkholderiaceae bacterium]
MDVALTNAIVNTATAMSRSETANAVQVQVLKKALDSEASAAATLLQALPQPPLATSGSLGTQVNTYA